MTSTNSPLFSFLTLSPMALPLPTLLATLAFFLLFLKYTYPFNPRAYKVSA